MATLKKEKKETITLVKLPQELLDKIFRLALPATFVGRAHEYNQDRNKAIGSIVAPGDSWREGVRLRSTHSKVLKAVDEGLSKINQLDIDVIDHGDCTPFWGPSEPHPFSTIMISESWEAIIKKNDITTITIINRFMPVHTRIHTGGDYTHGSFTAIKSNKAWKLQTVQWITLDEVFRRLSWVHWERMAEANKLMREGAIHLLLRTWTTKAMTVMTLGDMVRAMTLPTEQLQTQPWTVAAAKEAYYKLFQGGSSSMLVSLGRWHWNRRDKTREAVALRG